MPHTVEKYIGVLPSNLFICPDNDYSMHFVLQLKSFADFQLEDLQEILLHCGAEVSRDLRDVLPHSAIVVDHDDVVGIEVPAFMVKYLLDCLDSVELKNISNYRQDATKEIACEVDCMDIVYHRKFSWDEVLSGQRIEEEMESQGSTPLANALDEEQNHDSNTSRAPVDITCDEENRESNKHRPLIVITFDEEKCLGINCRHQKVSTLEKIWSFVKNRSTPQVNVTSEKGSSDNNTPGPVVDSTCDKEKSDSDTPRPPVEEKSDSDTPRPPDEEKSDSNTTRPRVDEGKWVLNRYRHQEFNTLDWILSTANERLGARSQHEEVKQKKKKIKVVTLSSDEEYTENPEDNQTKDPNSYRENKNHFTTKNEKSQMDKVSTNAGSEEIEQKSRNRSDKHLENNQKTSSTSRGTGESSQSAPAKKWKFLDDFCSSDSSDEENTKPKKTDDKKKDNFFDFEAGNEDLFKPTKDVKHKRKPYSHEERSDILRYIVNHQEHYRLKGRELWEVMERRKICPNRTWQSMKEHFLKKIAYDLDSFEFLTNLDKKKIKEALF